MINFKNLRLILAEIINCTFTNTYLIKKKTSKIGNETKLTKNTIEILLNEILTLDLEENEERVGKFSDIFGLKHN